MVHANFTYFHSKSSLPSFNTYFKIHTIRINYCMGQNDYIKIKNKCKKAALCSSLDMPMRESCILLQGNVY